MRSLALSAAVACAFLFSSQAPAQQIVTEGYMIETAGKKVKRSKARSVKSECSTSEAMPCLVCCGFPLDCNWQCRYK